MTGKGAEGPGLRGVTPFSRASDWARSALHTGKILLYCCDVETGRVHRSENSMQLVGLPVLGDTHRWSEGIFPEDLPNFENALRAISPEAPNFEVEYRIRHTLSGEWIWVLDRGAGEFAEDGRRVHVHGAIVDISARIGAETETRDAARLKSVVYEAARMGAWHLDIVTDQLTCSDELLRLLAIRREEFDSSPRAIERVVHPDDIASWQKAHETALIPGGRLEFEFRVILPTGHVRWFLTRGEVERDPIGTATESYGVMFDITERKAIEEAAATLAAVVASSEDAIISTDLNGIVSSWNKGAERLFGYSPAEMTGQSFFRIIPSDQAEEELSTFNTIVRGESITPYDSIRLRKDGSLLDVSLTLSAIRNASGQVIGTSTIARDITERHRHVEALRQNEQRLSLALKGARAGAWDYDVPRREMRWSPEMFILYGLDPETEKPPRDHFAAQVSPAFRERVQTSFTEAIARGGSFNLEFPIIRPDGTEIWTAVMGDVIEDGGGQPVAARGIDQDITERKNWDKRQTMLLRELSHRVKNTMAVIQAMTRQTLRVSRDPKTFADAFEGRIRSLASSHNLLTDAEWRGAKLTDVITSQVGGMVDSMAARFTLRGPDVLLPPEAATQLGLVLHELGTNAMKYGALSTPAGHITLNWTLDGNKLSLIWQERGGPPITVAPTHRGFGTALIESSAANVERLFEPGGLTCKLELAL